jgi:hypothetical protein
MKTFSIRSISILLLFLLSGCVAYSVVPANQTIMVNGISMSPTSAWNKSPGDLGKYTEVWTSNGELLDNIVSVGGVPVGEEIFKSPGKGTPMPVVSEQMLPNDIEALIVSSFKNLYGGEVQISSSNLKPSRLGDEFGVQFKLRYFSASGLRMAGDVLAALSDSKLYAIIYVAADTHYYEKHFPEVEQIFSSATLAP